MLPRFLPSDADVCSAASTSTARVKKLLISEMTHTSRGKMIFWDDSMKTGVPEIDSQHMELIEHFNQFSLALEQRKGREAAGQILDFLQFYAQWHFGREERCMEEYHCPVATANKKAHADFLKKFGKLYEQYQISDVNPQIIWCAFEELEAWIVNHIMRVDTRLNECVTHGG
jgi:hemerythrin